jgi:hypothetical protein
MLRLFFFLLGAIKPLQADLKNLSFIHFARWVIVGRNQFPHLSAISTGLGTGTSTPSLPYYREA